VSKEVLAIVDEAKSCAIRYDGRDTLFC
jgi:hypothetical protein